MTTYAKSQNNVAVQFTYGLPELRHDNPNIVYADNVDLVAAFNQSPQKTQYKFDLIEIVITDKPATAPEGYFYVYPSTATYQGDKFVADWELVKITPPPIPGDINTP